MSLLRCTLSRVIHAPLLWRTSATATSRSGLFSAISLARRFATEQQKPPGSESTQLAELKYSPKWEKAKETTKQASYWGISLIGVGAAGFFLYMVAGELFKKASPTKLQELALEKVQQHPELQARLGKPITPNLGRGGHGLLSTTYKNEGRKVTQVTFEVKGPHGNAVVRMEGWKDQEGNMQYSYIVVNVPHRKQPILINPRDEPAPAAAPASQTITEWNENDQ